MQPDPKLIDTLSQKADKADQRAQGWLTAAKVFAFTWIGGLGLNLYSQIKHKKPMFPGFGGWFTPISKPEGVIMGSMTVTGLMGAAQQNSAAAYQNSIMEIQKATSAERLSSAPGPECEPKIISSTETPPTERKP